MSRHYYNVLLLQQPYSYYKLWSYQATVAASNKLLCGYIMMSYNIKVCQQQGSCYLPEQETLVGGQSSNTTWKNSLICQ